MSLVVYTKHNPQGIFFKYGGKEMAKELNKIKSEKVTLLIKGKEREIKYGFSAWAVIEKEYGGLDKIEKLQEEVEKYPFSTLPKLLYIGLVDKEGVTEENVLDDYGLGDVEMITNVFTKALNGSLPEADESKKAGKEAK
jgi:hypothetical protein